MKIRKDIKYKIQHAVKWIQWIAQVKEKIHSETEVEFYYHKGNS